MNVVLENFLAWFVVLLLLWRFTEGKPRIVFITLFALGSLFILVTGGVKP